MPLSSAGEHTLENFIKEYGEEKGKKYFYSKENKDKKFKRTVTGKSGENMEIKESRSQYPANESGFTTSMGPADLSGFAEASKKASPLWWAARITRLPAAIKARLLKSLEFKPAVSWWTERIETLSTNVGKREEDDKEDHTAG